MITRRGAGGGGGAWAATGSAAEEPADAGAAAAAISGALGALRLARRRRGRGCAEGLRRPAPVRQQQAGALSELAGTRTAGLAIPGAAAGGRTSTPESRRPGNHRPSGWLGCNGRGGAAEPPQSAAPAGAGEQSVAAQAEAGAGVRWTGPPGIGPGCPGALAGRRCRGACGAGRSCRGSAAGGALLGRTRHYR